MLGEVKIRGQCSVMQCTVELPRLSHPEGTCPTVSLQMTDQRTELRLTRDGLAPKGLPFQSVYRLYRSL